MLISLYIKDFGLVDQNEIEFGPGLNVLTGETGAGKSIMLEALRAALGGRAQAEMIRTGRDRAVIQVTIDYSQLSHVKQKMSEYGLDCGDQDGNLLIMSRELNRQGRNVCRINGRIVSLGVYREIAGSIVDMHGQHDQQSLLVPEKQMLLLDSYGGSGLLNMRRETERAYREWQNHVRRRKEMISGGRERQQRRDMILYQIEEIDAAGLAGEDEQELKNRRELLANAERIRLLAEQVLHRIYTGTGQSPAAMDLLGQAKRDLEELSLYIPAGKTFLENVYSALCLVEETGRELAAYRESVEVNPQELDYIEERLSLIERLKRKYGDSLPEILAYRDNLASELEELESMETGIAGINELVDRCARQYDELAQKLEDARRAAASALSRAVEKELRDLEMNNVSFSVEVGAVEPGPTGKNKVEFLISPNQGEPLKPLAKIASGGELSRVMLAVKSILAGNDEYCTLVFDEVDAGIGGRTLQAVAEKLEQLGRQKQVLCVTHAATVAAYASTHYLIEKSSQNGKTVTSVYRLDGEARIKELSRMMGGDAESENLVQHVRQMLKN